MYELSHATEPRPEENGAESAEPNSQTDSFRKDGDKIVLMKERERDDGTPPPKKKKKKIKKKKKKKKNVKEREKKNKWKHAFLDLYLFPLNWIK